MLLVGTGAYAGASLAALRDRGVVDVRVFSPSGRAAKFALSHDVEPVEAADLLAALAGSDIVVTCSAATDPILTAAQLDEAMSMPGAARAPSGDRPRPAAQRRPGRRAAARRRTARPRDHQPSRPARGAERRTGCPPHRRCRRRRVRRPVRRAVGDPCAHRAALARVRRPRRRDRARAQPAATPASRRRPRCGTSRACCCTRRRCAPANSPAPARRRASSTPRTPCSGSTSTRSAAPRLRAVGDDRPPHPDPRSRRNSEQRS